MKPLPLASLLLWALALAAGSVLGQQDKKDPTVVQPPMSEQPTAPPQVPPQLPSVAPETAPPAATPPRTVTPPLTAPNPRATETDRAVSDPRQGGRISETAPSAEPPAGGVPQPVPGADRQPTKTGAERFREDIAQCDKLRGEERATCRRDVLAARSQGLYN
jgi:hypothetical protein